MSILTIRKANIKDCDLYYQWANDPLVRLQSFDTATIDYNAHVEWFNERINNPNFCFYIFHNEDQQNIGQVRITKSNDNTAIIGVSIDIMHRGNSYAPQILDTASNIFLTENPNYFLYAYIKSSNIASIDSFIKANFILKKELIYQKEPSVLYIKNINQCK